MMRIGEDPRGDAADQVLHNLIAGVLEHLACHVQTGRARSALLAAMLLDRLTRDPDLGAVLRLRAQYLRDVLEDRLLERPVTPAAPRPPADQADAAPRRPHRGVGVPWLTWERLDGNTG